MGTQTGSHVDATLPFSNTGETVIIGWISFSGEAVVIHVTDKKADEAITLEDIEENIKTKSPTEKSFSSIQTGIKQEEQMHFSTILM